MAPLISLLVLYGRRQALQQLDERKRDLAGDDEHRQAMDAQRDVVAREREDDARDHHPEAVAAAPGREPEADSKEDEDAGT